MTEIRPLCDITWTPMRGLWQVTRKADGSHVGFYPSRHRAEAEAIAETKRLEDAA